MPYRAIVVVVSDGCYRGEREDRSGVVLSEELAQAGFAVAERVLVPDETEAIVAALREGCSQGADLILTTGGTGFAPRDITPEATRQVLEREAPGLAEMLRWTGYQKTPRAVLSRGVAGLCGNTVIVNLPGSVGGVRDGLETLLPLLPHAIALLKDEPVDHSPAPLASSAAPPQDVPPQTVLLIETNIDDMSPEAYEIAIERLFAAGAVDVFLTPIQMKKSRPATKLSILVPPEKREELVATLFAETTAFGVRYAAFQRSTLERTWRRVTTQYGSIRIKVGRWKGEEMTAAPEYDDVKAAAKAHNAPIKQVVSAAMQAYSAETHRGE